MKKNATTRNYAIGVVMIFLLVANVTEAQTYFAGTGAGAGNTGTLVTGVGTFVLGSSNRGTANSGLGSNALFKNTTGASNVAVGTNGLYNNTTGSFNVAVGRSALYSNSTGSNNISVGYNSLYSNLTGYSNTAIGFAALKSNLTGYNNTAVGDSAMLSNTTGNRNTSVGFRSLQNNIGGVLNSALGEGTLFFNTTGFSNTAAGVQSLYSNTTGAYNTATGVAALNGNTTGNRNTAAGWQSLFSNGGGNNNSAYGYKSLNLNYGIENTGIGSEALSSNKIGNSNTAIGTIALHLSESANMNTAMGYAALYNYNVGDSNVAIGGWAGLGINTINKCVFLGAKTGTLGSASIINSTAIGFGANVDASNQVSIGNTSVTSIGGWANWTNFSDKRLKTNISKSTLGLDFILSLNPVTYNYTVEGQQGILQTGLIAQEVDEAAKNAGANFSGVDKSGEYWGLRYATLTVPLIKAVQEMEESNKELRDEVKILKESVRALQLMFAKLAQTEKASPANESKSKLFQNEPNPFNSTTVVRYFIAEKFSNASVALVDFSGRIIKQYTIANPGDGKIIINAGDLPSGIYTSMLSVNGITVSSKKVSILK